MCHARFVAERIQYVYDSCHRTKKLHQRKRTNVEVEDPNKAPLVAGFMAKGLQKIAEHYHVAIVLSVGAPKVNKQNAPAARRDMVFGSQNIREGAGTKRNRDFRTNWPA
jgi:hypothetical protein